MFNYTIQILESRIESHKKEITNLEKTDYNKLFHTEVIIKHERWINELQAAIKLLSS